MSECLLENSIDKKKFQCMSKVPGEPKSEKSIFIPVRQMYII